MKDHVLTHILRPCLICFCFFEYIRNILRHYEALCSQDVKFSCNKDESEKCLSDYLPWCMTSQRLCFCQSPNLTSTQGWVWPENDFAHTTETQCQQYLSCYWPNFDETLKVGSCEHLEHMPTVRVTFVHVRFVLATFVHIRNISTVTDPILMKLYS